MGKNNRIRLNKKRTLTQMEEAENRIQKELKHYREVIDKVQKRFMPKQQNEAQTLALNQLGQSEEIEKAMLITITPALSSLVQPSNLLEPSHGALDHDLLYVPSSREYSQEALNNAPASNDDYNQYFASDSYTSPALLSASCGASVYSEEKLHSPAPELSSTPSPASRGSSVTPERPLNLSGIPSSFLYGSSVHSELPPVFELEHQPTTILLPHTSASSEAAMNPSIMADRNPSFYRNNFNKLQEAIKKENYVTALLIKARIQQAISLQDIELRLGLILILIPQCSTTFLYKRFVEPTIELIEDQIKNAQFDYCRELLCNIKYDLLSTFSPPQSQVTAPSLPSSTSFYSPTA
jgi:hypothetical protein